MRTSNGGMIRELGERACDERRAPRTARRPGRRVPWLRFAIVSSAGCSVKQRPDDAARRAAGTEHDDALRPASVCRRLTVTSRMKPMPSVLSPLQSAVDDADRVDRAGCGGGCAVLVAQRERGLLVRHGDVQPFAAGRAEAAHGRFERRRLGVDELVGETLARLPREHRMDQRRAAVLHGVADEGVAVGRRLLVIGHLRGFLCFRILRGFRYRANRTTGELLCDGERQRASYGARGAKASTPPTRAITTRSGACPCATTACTSSSSCSRPRRRA